MIEGRASQPHVQPARGRRRPSFTTIVALVALVIAMGTTAQALPGRGSVKTDDIKNGAVTTPKIRNGAVTPAKIRDHAMWALVRANGTLVQGVGVDAINHPDPGIYQVRFTKRVTNRALTATIYNTAAGAGQVNVLHCDPAHPVGGTALDPAFDVPECVFVNTEASDGTNADNTFLVIALPSTPGVTVAPRLAGRQAGGEARH